MSTRGSGLSGWVTFAGILAVVVGFVHVMSGIAAIAEDDTLVAQATEVLYGIDVTTWGWAWLALGVLQIGTGIAITRRVAAGQVIGIILAGISAVLASMAIFSYPLWATVVVIINILVIYALTAHGDEFDGTHVTRPRTLSGVDESPGGW